MSAIKTNFLFKNFQGHSNAAQITRTFTWMLLLIVLITGTSIATVVGYRLTRSRMDDAETLIKSLKRSVIDDKPDWHQWSVNSPINTENTYVIVHTRLPQRAKHVFYSNDAQDFLKAREWTAPIFTAVRYREGFGLFYRSSYDANHIYYETWTSLDDVLHVFTLVIKDLLLTLVVCGLLGYFIASRLARRLNQPLATLTNAAKKVNHASNITYHEVLPVPAHPDEVHDLGTEINLLLKSLNEQALRDHQFVSDASHELRTPLTAIRGHINLINRHAADHPEVIPRSLKAIDHESARMQSLVESLLRLSRMDHATVTTQTINVNLVVQEVAANYQSNLSQPLNLTLPKSPVMAQFNSDNLQQILIALLNNAGKYSPADQPITITVNSSPQPTIAIADHGMGIPDDSKANVFERFYRVDQARSQTIPGTGLGLAIVARLADLNHAQIKLTDNQPKGSIFTLSLARPLDFTIKKDKKGKK